MIKVVVFDLDDTLYPEIEYVKSGFRAVATKFGNKTLYKKLWRLWKQNKDNVYQRAAFSTDNVALAIDTYRNHKPEIQLKRNVRHTLQKLHQKGFRIGIITDGRPSGQKRKIEALGLTNLTDHIIITDELGGPQFRKPNPAAFIAMKNFFGVEYCEMIYIGDNPKKDFVAPSSLGMKTCFLFSKKGLYSKLAEAETDFHICKIADVAKILTGGINE